MSQKPEAHRILVCVCGCSSFTLREDGSTVCPACGIVDCEDVAWWQDMPAPECKKAPFIEMTGGREFAQRRLVTLAAEPDAALIVVRRKSGTVSVWRDGDRKKHVRWALRGLKEAKRLIKRGS